MNPIRREERKYILCVFKTIKDNNKTAHWVGHSKLRSVYIDEFFKKTPKIYEKEASVTVKTEEEKNTAKTNTDDSNENVEDNERIRKDKGKLVTMKEEIKTFEYQ